MATRAWVAAVGAAVAVLGFGVTSGCGVTKSTENLVEHAATPASGEFPCVPITCQTIGRYCGTTSDGCGGTLNCGTCADGMTCGETGVCCGGHPDACAPGESTSQGALSLALSGDYRSVTSDVQGHLYALRGAETGMGSLVEELQVKDGDARWSVSSPSPLDSILASPTGQDLFASGLVKTSDRALADTVEERFTKEGEGPFDERTLSGVSGVGLAAIGYAGQQLVLRDGAVRVTAANGQLTFNWPTGDNQPDVVLSDAAFDFLGNVFVVGQTKSEFTWNSAMWASGAPFIAKLTPKGELLWARQVNIPGEALEVKTLLNGNAYVTGNFVGERFAFGGVSSLAGAEGVNGFLVTYGPNGEEHFSTTWSNITGWPKLAIDNSGAGYVGVAKAACGGMEVSNFAPNGDLTWRRAMSLTKCTGETRITSMTAAMGHAVLVTRLGGELKDGRTVVSGKTGALLELNP